MEDNPFSTIINVIREDNRAQTPVTYRLGTVITAETVEVAGNMQGKDALLKNSLISDFEVGDRLLMIPIEDEQRYIILCKVVEL